MYAEMLFSESWTTILTSSIPIWFDADTARDKGRLPSLHTSRTLRSLCLLFTFNVVCCFVQTQEQFLLHVNLLSIKEIQTLIRILINCTLLASFLLWVISAPLLCSGSENPLVRSCGSLPSFSPSLTVLKCMLNYFISFLRLSQLLLSFLNQKYKNVFHYSLFETTIQDKNTLNCCFLFVGSIRFEKPRDCDFEELDQGQHWGLQMYSQQWCGRGKLHSGGQDALWVKNIVYVLYSMSKRTGFQATASGVVPLAHVQHLENIIQPFLGPTFSLILCYWC